MDKNHFNQICQHYAAQQSHGKMDVLKLEHVSLIIVNEILAASSPGLIHKTVQHTSQPPVVPVNQPSAMSMARTGMDQNSISLQVCFHF